MNFSSFNTANRPNRIEMEEIGKSLLASLAAHLNRELQTFKEHYVEEGSVVLTFRSVEPIHGPLAIEIEGCVLFDVRSPGSLPSVDAEILLFSFGKRIGLQSNGGNGYMRFSYDEPSHSWGSPIWLADTPEDWESVKQLRESDYLDVVKTYDFGA
ncbi:UNVERIFIED_ORG: hypothetical protein ABIC62_005675 [Burkholderia sp. 1595]|uniref:Uncharacterized protein n=1 Tax=Paraburkholderia terricola TaxID=169427 RepID=A0ABU1M035_9BURK|nr:hypothetical protein [Paraburkholderia terricola]MDR6412249.1 hypothetical protein [Paraburkholderia terricola]